MDSKINSLTIVISRIEKNREKLKITKEKEIKRVKKIVVKLDI